MENFKLDTSCGHTFSKVAERAKQIATESMMVEFDFNGVKCIVSNTTNADWLYRDYYNAWTMKWKVVGPECYESYEPEVQAELERLTKIEEEESAKREEEYRKKEAAEKMIFDARVAGIELELKDVDGWNKNREINTDPYGSAALDYAEGWAKLMQSEISRGNKLSDIAEKTSFELGFMGITGFMYGCAVNILSQCWIYGEELRLWHNGKYKHEGSGVVNPAVLSVKI